HLPPENPMRSALVLATVFTLALTASSAWAEPDCEAARCVADAAIASQCPCDAATSNGTYRSCVSRALRDLVNAGLFPRDCRGTVKRCAARSTCGRPQFIACDLGDKCLVKKAERCEASGGVVRTTR